MLYCNNCCKCQCLVIINLTTLNYPLVCHTGATLMASACIVQWNPLNTNSLKMKYRLTRNIFQVPSIIIYTAVLKYTHNTKLDYTKICLTRKNILTLTSIFMLKAKNSSCLPSSQQRQMFWVEIRAKFGQNIDKLITAILSTPFFVVTINRTNPLYPCTSHR